jgi:hypothetical protein
MQGNRNAMIQVNKATIVFVPCKLFAPALGDGSRDWVVLRGDLRVRGQ